MPITHGMFAQEVLDVRISSIVVGQSGEVEDWFGSALAISRLI
jgi:hypothetical protein